MASGYKTINYKCYKYSISILFIITEYIILVYIKDIAGDTINCFVLLLLIDDWKLMFLIYLKFLIFKDSYYIYCILTYVVYVMVTIRIPVKPI